MNFLANVPIWVYFVVLAVTFMVVHLMALRADQPDNRRRSIAGRVISSILLLIALYLIDPGSPPSILFALLVSAGAGFISGRTATPPLPPRRAAPPGDAGAQEDGSDKVE